MKTIDIVATKPVSVRKRALSALAVAVSLTAATYGLSDAHAQTTLTGTLLTGAGPMAVDTGAIVLTGGATGSTWWIGGSKGQTGGIVMTTIPTGVYQLINNNETPLGLLTSPVTLTLNAIAGVPDATALIAAGHDTSASGNTIILNNSVADSKITGLKLAGAVSNTLNNGAATPAGIVFSNNRVFIGYADENTLSTHSTEATDAAPDLQFGTLINTTGAAGTSLNSIDGAELHVGNVGLAFASLLRGGMIINDNADDALTLVNGGVSNSRVVIATGDATKTIATALIVGGQIQISNSIKGAGTGALIGNSVELQSGGLTEATSVRGAEFVSAVNGNLHVVSLQDNSVVVRDGFVFATDKVYNIIGALSNDALTVTATGNHVTIGDSTFTEAGTIIAGAHIDATSLTKAVATGNTVTLDGTKFGVGGGQIVYGANIQSDANIVEATLSDNELILDGVDFDPSMQNFFAAARLSTDTSVAGDTITASGNTLTVTGSSETGSAHFIAAEIKVNSSLKTVITADGNVVSLSADTIMETGTVNISAVSTDSTNTASIFTNNTVILGAGERDATNTVDYTRILNINAVSALSGAAAVTTAFTTAPTGNTLKTFGQLDVGAADIGGFQRMELSIDGHVAASGALLTTTGGITGGAKVDDALVIALTTAEAGVISHGTDLTIFDVGADSKGFIKVEGMTGAVGEGVLAVSNSAFTTAFTSTDVDLVAGEMNLSGAKTVVITAGRSFVNESGESAFSGRVGGAVSAVVQGADMVAGPGTVAAVASAGSAPRSWTAFSSLSAGKSTFDVGTASDIDVDSATVIIGLAKSIPLMNNNDILVAGFFEYGWGDVESNFNGGTNGGDSNYYGGGLLARYSHNSGFYGKGSVRLGESESTLDYQSGLGSYNHEDTSAYYSISVGAGYEMPVSVAGKLDLYGNYSFGQVDGETTILSGALYDFDDISSQRTELGARYHHAVSQVFTPYIGATWQHEFDGEAKGRIAGLSVDGISLDGSTGVFEGGLNVRPNITLPLTVDLNVTGYVGQREGVTGNLRVSLDF